MISSNNLRWLAAAMACITALFPLRTAGWLITLYATHGGSLFTGLRLATPALLWALVYLASAILYIRFAAARLPLLIAATLLAITGAVRIPSYIHQLSTLNPWRNLLATGFWETLGCAAFALTALVHLLAVRFAQPRHAL